jgi:DNA polymerase IIIc chi subunit
MCHRRCSKAYVKKVGTLALSVPNMFLCHSVKKNYEKENTPFFLKKTQKNRKSRKNHVIKHLLEIKNSF